MLRSTAPSTSSRTSRHINLGQSSFFALNRVGTRFGCLHPITALRLYTSISLPKMFYGAELWCLTNTKLEMLERSHRKILRSIQGLPLRCPKEGVGTLLGCSTIADLITTKKLSFLLSIATLPYLRLGLDRFYNADSKNLTPSPGSLTRITDQQTCLTSPH